MKPHTQTMVPTFLLPFKGRLSTGPTDLNLLWRCRNVYVMDNHRAAGWCWAQHVKPGLEHGLFHIDRHWDTRENDLADCVAMLPDGIPADVADYLDLAYVPTDPVCQGNPIKVFQWDNYLPIHLKLHGEMVSPLIMATHRDGSPPRMHPYAEVATWDLLDALGSDIGESDRTWIVNVDIDYFFCNEDDDCVRFLDDAYVEALATTIGRLNAEGKLAVVTIALTATETFTDGWPQAEAIAERMCAAMGLNFKLP